MQRAEIMAGRKLGGPSVNIPDVGSVPFSELPSDIKSSWLKSKGMGGPEEGPNDTAIRLEASRIWKRINDLKYPALLGQTLSSEDEAEIQQLQYRLDQLEQKLGGKLGYDYGGGRMDETDQAFLQALEDLDAD